MNVSYCPTCNKTFAPEMTACPKCSGRLLGGSIQAGKKPESVVAVASGAVSCSSDGRRNLTLPYPPSANRYWRTIVNKRTGRAMVFVSTEAKEYKKAIAKLTGAFAILTGPIGMRVRVFRPQRSGDLGNRLKVLEDALQGVVYQDDNQIEYEESFRFDDKENPRVEVEVWALNQPQGSLALQ